MHRKNPLSVDTSTKRVNLCLPNELVRQLKMAVPFDISGNQFIENALRDQARAMRTGTKAREQNTQPILVDTHHTAHQSVSPLLPTSTSTASEGQKLLLTISCLLDKLLTQRHGDWQLVLNDETNELSEGFFIKGRLRISAIVEKIVHEIPPGLGGAGPGKTTTKNVNQAVKFLTEGQEHLVDLSAQGKPKAYRTLFGLALAVWRSKSKPPYPELPSCEYPASIITDLDKNLTEVEHDVLATCLENARQQVIRQSQALVTLPE